MGLQPAPPGRVAVSSPRRGQDVDAPARATASQAEPEATPGGAVVLVLGALTVALVVWFLRRPDQFLHPYVWSDEYHILNLYQAHGLLAAVLTPLKGYFVWPTSFSIGFGAWASFLHLPEVDYWLSTAWFVATVLLVLVPRSRVRLRWRAGFVMLLVLAPMNPEVFGIALYTFWWTSLWPLISFTWSKDYWWLRAPVLVLGGMSSIAGAALVVPSALVFVLGRRRRDLVGTVVLGVTLVAQAGAYLTSARSQETPLYPGRVVLQELRNFSDYALAGVKHPDPALLDTAGAGVLVVVVAVVWTTVLPGTRHRWTPITLETVPLVVGLFVVGLVSAVPAPLMTNPTSNGPRYYFLPFVVLGWVLLMAAVTARRRWARLVAAALIVVSLLNLSVEFSRHEPTVSWSDQLARCRTATRPFYVPVQFTGVVSQMWETALVISPATCRRLGYPRYA